MNNWDEWRYYNPDEDRRRLNKALDDKGVRGAFHNATFEYILATIDELHEKGIENTEHLENIIKGPFLKEDSFLQPQDAHCGDMWCGIRPRKWHRYTCSRACHWMADGYVALAEKLFPNDKWTKLSTKEHTAVVCFEKKMVFDLYYFAASVPIDTALKMVYLKPTEEG